MVSIAIWTIRFENIIRFKQTILHGVDKNSFAANTKRERQEQNIRSARWENMYLLLLFDSAAFIIWFPVLIWLPSPTLAMFWLRINSRILCKKYFLARYQKLKTFLSCQKLCKQWGEAWAAAKVANAQRAISSYKTINCQPQRERERQRVKDRERERESKAERVRVYAGVRAS